MTNDAKIDCPVCGRVVPADSERRMLSTHADRDGDECSASRTHVAAGFFARERELDGATHRTADDACAQVARAKVGAHVAATDTYLHALLIELEEWAANVRSELARREEARAEHDFEGEDPHAVDQWLKYNAGRV